MNMNFVNAAAAYGKSAQPTGAMESRDASSGNFANTLQNFLGGSIDTMKQAETTAMSGLGGSINIADVVTAISKAEVTLQAVVAVRDKVVSGYQEIMRMPI